MKKEYRKGFKDGWLEAIGWINGEVEIEKERFAKKQYQLIKSILTKWLKEWENSVKLKP